MSSPHSPIIRTCGVSAERHPSYQLKDHFPHGHDVVELFFVRSGRGTHLVGDRPEELSPGDMGVVPLGKTHCILSRDEPMDILNIYLDPERFCRSPLTPALQSLLKHLQSGGFLAGDRVPFSSTWTPGTNTQVFTILASIELEISQRRAGFEQALEMYVRLLLLECARESLDCRNPARIFEAVSSPPMHPCVQRAINYLHDHWDENVDLAALVRHTRASKYHLCRLFRRETGVTIIGYLQRLRIREAMRLLQESSHKVITIASETGFGDLANFNRTFRRITGMTPTQFRQASQENTIEVASLPGYPGSVNTRNHQGI